MVTLGRAQLRILAKPKFSDGSGGFWVNPDYLAADLKATLWGILPARLPYEQRCYLLSLTGEAVQELAEQIERNPAAAVKGMIREVESKAHALLVALNKLSEDAAVCLNAHGDALAWLSNPPIQLSLETLIIARSRIDESALLSYLWDAAQDLEKTAWYASSLVTPNKTARPSQALGRNLVRRVAHSFHRVTGKLPPSSKEAWFPKFIQELGKSVGPSIGTAMVASVLQEMKDSGQYLHCETKPVPPEILVNFKPPLD